MSDKLSKLKQKLKKQKETPVKKVVKIQKKRKTPPVKKEVVPKKKPTIMPTISSIEKASKQDEKLRKQLKEVLDGNYDQSSVYNRFYELSFNDVKKANPGANIDSILKDLWENLPDDSKKEFALEVIGGKKKEPWGISGLIQKLLNLPPDLQDDFITSYLEQPVGYDEFYNKWSQRPQIAPKIKEYVEKGDSGETVTELQTMRNTLYQRAVQYAEEKGVEIPEQKEQSFTSPLTGVELKKSESKMPYTQILSKITSKPEKLHKKLAKDYIEIAEALGKENADEMTVADLLSFIYHEKKKLYSSLKPEVIKKFTDMSDKKLRKEGKNIGIENADTLSQNALLIYVLKTNVEIAPIQSKKDLIKEATELGIPDPENYEKISLRAKIASIKAKKAKQSRSVKKLPDKETLAEKLSRITGQPKHYYMDWSWEELQERYQAIEEGEEFWEEFERETIIDALVKIANTTRDSYKGRDTASLIKELEMLSEKKEKSQQIIAESIYAKKCADEFRQYKWIDAKVTGVWLYGSRPMLKEYATDTYIAVPGKGKFYQANVRFFNLLCNKYANEMYQEGDTLTCFDRDHRPVQLKIGYSIEEKYKYRKQTWPILVAVDAYGQSMGKYRKNRLLIQDEGLFQSEKKYIEDQKKNETSRIKNAMTKLIDEKSIMVAKQSLSEALRTVCTNIKDYQLNSPYINIAVDSVIKKNQTNEELFEFVADFKTYLYLQKANIFRKRIQAEYYLPDMLLRLSPEDKLPEVFDPLSAVSKKTIDVFTSYIHNSTKQEITFMIENLIGREDPTGKKKRPLLVVPEINYDQSVCVNVTEEEFKKIPPENRVFYNDTEEEKVYCFDIDELIRQFNDNDYIIPKMNKPFDKNFVRRYTVMYYDDEDDKNYIFSYKKLYDRLKSGNIINPETGRVFKKSFIRAILRGGSWGKSAHLLQKKFDKLDRRLAMCKNSIDILHQPLESIIYYKDPDDNSIYCFTISKITEIINKEAGINPRTGKRFSKNFIKRFNKVFSSSLKKKGINQPQFREIYGEDVFKNIPLPLKEKKEKKEEKEEKEELIIPDLWSLISSKFEKKAKASFSMGDNVEENQTIEEGDDTTENEETEEEDETDEDETDEDETTDEEEDEEDDETTTEEEHEDKDKKKDKAKEKDENDKEDVKMAFASDSCQNCKKKCEEVYKSVMMQNNKPKPCQFCSLKCMEKFKFPKFKK